MIVAFVRFFVVVAFAEIGRLEFSAVLLVAVVVEEEFGVVLDRLT